MIRKRNGAPGGRAAFARKVPIGYGRACPPQTVRRSPVFAIVLALADLAAFYSFFLSRKLRAHPAAKAIFVAAAAWLIVCNVVRLFEPDSAAYDAIAAVLNFLCLLSFFFIFEKSAYAQSLGLNVAAWVAFLLHMILPLLMLFALTAAALVWLLVLEIVTRIAYLAFLGGLKKVWTHPVRTVLHDPRG